jgi:hypothetical protein
MQIPVWLFSHYDAGNACIIGTSKNKRDCMVATELPKWQINAERCWTSGMKYIFDCQKMGL